MNPLLNICYFSEPQPYSLIYQQMRTYTEQRDKSTPDALWLLEHQPVFTQGQAGKKEHLLHPGTIPVIQSDRGGQVTYHGPGQLVVYVLFDLKRADFGLKHFTEILHNSVINLLADYGIKGECIAGAPGVYINGEKICSLGLRVRKGCTYHGLSLNINMDLTPFLSINPCGFTHLKMTQLSHFRSDLNLAQVKEDIVDLLTPPLATRNKHYE